MPTLTIDIDIAAEPDRVFAGLLSSAGYRDWMTFHESWPEGPPELTLGGSFSQAVTLMGRSARVTWTVNELDSPSTLSLDGVGRAGLAMRCVYRVDEVEVGSRLRFESVFEGGPVPLDGRLGSVLVKRARAASEESMSNFAALLESGSLPHTSRRRSPALLAGALAGQRGRVRLPMVRWASNARLIAAIEENTRAIDALREEIAHSAHSDKRASPSAWLTAPFDLLRRGSAGEGRESDVEASRDRSS